MLSSVSFIDDLGIFKPVPGDEGFDKAQYKEDIAEGYKAPDIPLKGNP